MIPAFFFAGPGGLDRLAEFGDSVIRQPADRRIAAPARSENASNNQRSLMEAFDLTGSVAVVTGGGQGIGEGIAKNLAKAGASVVVAARHADRIARVADDIIAAGGQALAVTTDVTDRAALVALADAAVDTFGGLHVWVNNAGGSTIRTPLKELVRGRLGCVPPTRTSPRCGVRRSSPPNE